MRIENVKNDPKTLNQIFVWKRIRKKVISPLLLLLRQTQFEYAGKRMRIPLWIIWDF